ncbi:RIP metalloprotease RseP [Rhodobacteraceae bacterium NNCM2]|nr:RIP metalloprotease RseP [Coraliihabitans acroporae]
MNFIAEIPLIGNALSIAVPFLIVLGVVVFVHEYGHYIVGRWCGIQAETFSIGFGPRLASWRDRRGTRWQIAAIPLGGFVKFVGDMDPASGMKSNAEMSEEERKVAFHNASIRSRALTVLAGPVANFLLSIVIYTGIALYVGQASDAPIISQTQETTGVSEGLEAGDKVLAIDGQEIGSWGAMINALQKTDGEPVSVDVERGGERETVTVRYRNAPVVEHIRPGMPAAQAGMVNGDVIISVNGQKIDSFQSLRVLAANLPLETEIEVVVERDGEERIFNFIPDTVERAHPETDEVVPQATMGISSITFGGLHPEREPIGVFSAIAYGFTATWAIVDTTMTFLGDMLFSNADTGQLGGPIGIAKVSADQAKAGFENLIALIALLSTSIGLLNLFPIPILDGGHLVFYLAEAIRGKPLGERWMNAAMGVGLSLVLLLMCFATYNDLSRL